MKKQFILPSLVSLILGCMMNLYGHPVPVTSPGQSALTQKTYINKSGTVYSARPGSASFRATTDEVTIKVTKTGGQAETQVNIYVNNRLTKKMEFDNGRYSNKAVTRVLKGVKNKNIQVKIVNQSVTNTFKYKLLCTGDQPAGSLCPKVIEKFSGTVYSVRPRAFTLKPQCNDLLLKVAKTGGKAETQVNVYVNGRFQHAHKLEFDNGNGTRTRTTTLRNVKGRTVKVEIVNQSATNTFKYTFTATQQN